jgi:transcriptional regulator with XRE-family HTH domain
MRWYRQRLGLSLHQVHELTGIDRAYLRRLERRRIHLSLTVLWRWCNGLHVNVDWVLKMTRRQVLLPLPGTPESSVRLGGESGGPLCKSAAGCRLCP